MTKWMWNPCQDVQHDSQVNDYVTNRDGYELLTAWSDIKKDDDLIIAGHGSDTDPNSMAGVASDGTHYVVDYNWLASAVSDGVQNTGLAFQIKLYMCNSAHRVKVGNEKLSFGGQFFAALKAKGYKKVKVAAYHGELHWGQGHTNKVVCTRKVNPGTLLLGESPIGAGILIMTRKGYGAARHRREWFTDNPLGTRWL